MYKKVLWELKQYFTWCDINVQNCKYYKLVVIVLTERGGVIQIEVKREDLEFILKTIVIEFKVEGEEFKLKGRSYRLGTQRGAVIEFYIQSVGVIEIDIKGAEL